jgi:hypothetical protein
MLDLGVPLSRKIEVKTIEDKTVHSVNDGYLLACFESVTDALVTAIAYAILCRVLRQQFRFRQYVCELRADFQDVQPNDAKEGAVDGKGR